MLEFVDNRLPEGEIPESWETEEEKKLSDRDLKSACFTLARSLFQGKSFRNNSINRDITVSRDGLGEWKTVTKSRDQALSMKILDVLLKNASYWREEPPKNADPNIAKIIYFRGRCKVNGTEYRAVITVKVYKTQNYHKYYHHYLDDPALAPGK
jgi:hypothetical protein